MAYAEGDALKTIDKDGKVPECRMEDAASVQAFVRRLIDGDQKRDRLKGKVAGLVDGNPPYSNRRLREAGRADAANVNDGSARSYLEGASGAFYDLSSQAPGFVQIETSHGNEEQRVEWSRLMSKYADQAFAADDDFDNDMQLSQNEMILYGHGPLFFEDEHQVFPTAIQDAALKFPDWTPSKMSRWEVAVLLFDYYPPELYAFIRKEERATQVGWDVDFSKMVIANAMDVKQPDSTNQNTWLFYQNELKSNSMSYYTNSKICKLAHVFWKEFDGRITHAIVERESSTGVGARDSDNSYAKEIEHRGVKYLYIHQNQYKSFKECLHAMYMDRGRAGLHHTVTGLGVKMFSLMEYNNRLYGNLLDKAFAPKQYFTPANAESKEKFQIAKFSDWGLLPPGTTIQQTPIQGFITDGLSMYRNTKELLSSNLSSYRQPVDAEKPGNPVTKFEKQVQVSQQSELSTTTFNRYYRQLDVLYREIVRRLCNLNTTDQRAKDFQEACEMDGVPRECFGRVRNVRAVRVVGRGSPFLRAQTTSELAQVIGRSSEDGQNNWYNDFIASRAGQDAVARYNPKPLSKQLASDQQERAGNQVTGMKIGKPPDITNSQNPLTFAGVYLSALVQAIQSVEKGAPLPEVVRFSNLCGPAVQAQIKRMAGDALRADVAEELQKQLDQAEKIVQQFQKKLQEQAKQRQAQQGKMQQAMGDMQIKGLKVAAELKLKEQKQKHAMMLQNAKTRQQLALADATTASNIHNQNRLAAFKE